MATKRNLPAGFVVSAQPIEQHQPPAGRDWVHEIKHPKIVISLSTLDCAVIAACLAQTAPKPAPKSRRCAPDRPIGTETRHHAVTVRANIRSILVAMMKSFSCS